ncbi:MAG: hypothetical protein NT007_00265 [Candidatus Kapabacteria bacterium]|nr:hypothetical protein [Candidatus Kapabacteria bacterium]
MNLTRALFTIIFSIFINLLLIVPLSAQIQEDPPCGGGEGSWTKYSGDFTTNDTWDLDIPFNKSNASVAYYVSNLVGTPGYYVYIGDVHQTIGNNSSAVIYYREAIKSFILNVLTYFPNISDLNSGVNVVFKFPSCAFKGAGFLHKGEVGIAESWIYVGPCVPISCCEISITIQRNSEGKIVIRQIVNNNIPQDCNFTNHPDFSLGLPGQRLDIYGNCEQICNIGSMFIPDTKNVTPIPCFVSCNGNIEDLDFSTFSTDGIICNNGGTQYHLKPHYIVQTCSDGSVRITLIGFNVDKNNLSESERTQINEFLINYALLYLSGNKISRNVTVSIPPLYDEFNTGNYTKNNSTSGCCDLTFKVYNEADKTYANLMNSTSCPEHDFHVPQNPGIWQSDVTKLPLPSNMADCDLQCYWRTDGNNIITTPNNFIGPTNGQDFIIKTGNANASPSTLQERIRVRGDGNIKIGNIPYIDWDNNALVQMKGNLLIDGKVKVKGSNNGLIVEGKISTTDLIVESPTQLSWPDYIFEKGFTLQSFDSLSRYIKSNKRLPGIPSAEAVTKNGINVGEMQIHILEQIEIMNLYILELNKQNIEAKKQIELLNNKIKQLESK